MNRKHLHRFGQIATFVALLLWSGCARVKVEPVEVNVQPIHVTVDVNIKIQKVDRALDDFFADIDAPPAPAAQTQAPAKEKQP